MKFYDGQRIRLIWDGEEGIPRGATGLIIGQDYGDTDFRTYEVVFDNGVLARQVREYHLAREE